MTSAELGGALTLVGRERELEQLLKSAAARALCSIVGPPGVGKSHLARVLCAQFDGPKLWLELGGERELLGLCVLLAGALGVELDAQVLSTQEAAQVLGAAADAAGLALLVLDGVDRLCGELEPWLTSWREAAPRVALVCTSCRALALQEMTSVSLGPLSPQASVELFVHVAKRANAGFELNASMRAQLLTLVAHLDGLPLAIELAAARVHVLPPVELLRRLERRFELLRGRDKSGMSRSLEAALELAWQGLSALEREVLSQAAIFDGAFSLEAAEALLSAGEVELIDVLESLVESSFVVSRVSERFGGELRLGLLECVREYVRLRQPHPEDGRLQRAYRAHYLERASQWLARGQRVATASDRWRLWEARAHLERIWRRCITLSEEDAEVWAQAAGALDGVYGLVGGVDAHEPMLRHALAQVEGTPHEATLLLMLGEYELGAGRARAACEFFIKALGLGASTSRTRDAMILLRLAEAQRVCGDHVAAQATLSMLEPQEASLDRSFARLYWAMRAAVCADAGDVVGRELALERLSAWREGERWRVELLAAHREAYACFYAGDVDRQRRVHTRAALHAEQVDSPLALARARLGVAEASFALGDWDAATQGFELAHEILARQGQRALAAICLGNLGASLHRQEQLERAKVCYLEALARHHEHGAALYVGVVTMALAVLYHERGERGLAARYYQLAMQHHLAQGCDDDAGAASLCWGWLELELGREAHALERLEEASARFSAASSEGWVEVVAWSMRLCGVAIVQIGEQAQGMSAYLCQILRAQLTQDAAQLEVFGRDVRARGSLYGRLALGLSGGMRPSVVPSPSEGEVAEVSQASFELSAPVLNVGAGARWFEVDAQERVNLSRRKALRLVLEALIQAHQDVEQGALDVHALFDRGWPGQHIAHEQAVERVYWAVRTLRSLGLDGVLLTLDEGYALDSKVLIIQEES